MQQWGVGNDYAVSAIATKNWAMMQISNYPVSAMKQTTNERSRDAIVFASFIWINRVSLSTAES
jgi:hypothetical protein